MIKKFAHTSERLHSVYDPSSGSLTGDSLGHAWNPKIQNVAERDFGKSGIYLDYASTTPVDPAVAVSMSYFLGVDGIFGNPASGTHSYGHAAADAVGGAYHDVAALLCADPNEIIWTSGATESINLALKGTAFNFLGQSKHIVTSPLEHQAVLDSLKWLESQGFEIGFIEPDKTGMITPSGVANALRPETILVTLMHVNNETGTVTDMASMRPVIQKSSALLHVDATQGAARLPLAEVAQVADLISISAHKMYGPKGIGALRIRRNLQDKIIPQIHGGGHQFGLRSGTLPTHQIVGMGTAAKLVVQQRSADSLHIAALDKQLCSHLSEIDRVQVNGTNQNRVPGIINIYFHDIEAESLMIALGDVAISSGSACTSTEISPSSVLLALGYSPKRAMASVRISFGRFTTMDEIDFVGKLFRSCVEDLRRI